MLSSSRCALRRLRLVRQQHNDAILAMLTRYREQEENAPDRNGYRIRAYTAAIQEIKYLDKPIETAKDTIGLKGIGPGIAKRIEQYFQGYDPKTLNKNQRLREEENKRAVLQLTQVPGIGVTTAKALVAQGCLTIADMHKPAFSDLLTLPQKTYLKYYEHLKQPVTRTEIETIATFIRQNIPPEFEVVIAGAYRRGFPISTDIDILLFHPEHVHIPSPTVPSTAIEKLKTKATRRGRLDHAFRENFTPIQARSMSLLLQEVVPVLEERGLLATTLRSGSRKWQGIVRIPSEEDGKNGLTERKERLRCIAFGRGVFRKVDINLVPMKSRGAALLAVTGDIEFVRDLRLRAVRMGMYLDEFGLWKWNETKADEEEPQPKPKSKSKRSSSQDASTGYWELIRAESEEDIMAELGMEYVDPVKRNFSYLVHKENRTRVSKVVRPVIVS